MKRQYTSIPLIEYWETLANKEYEQLEYQQGISEVRYRFIFVSCNARCLEAKLKETLQNSRRKKRGFLTL